MSDERISCASRRHFLLASGLATSTVLLRSIFGDRVLAQDADRQVSWANGPRVRLAALADLKEDQPLSFAYPPEMSFGEAILVKLGQRAGGGVGPEQDIVAFSSWCTHMGGDLSGEYNAEYKVAGPCREHLTTFDLTRHGMVVAGHATATLPQIVLELTDDELFAVGIVGLLYGYSSNPGLEERS